MIKLKKLLAGVLGAAMVMTSMSVTALASSTEPVTTDAVINEAQSGSITVHKYTTNSTKDSSYNSTGTTADAGNLTESAEAIKDVGFTVYQVVDTDDVIAYYNTNPTTLPAATDYYEKESTGEIKVTGKKIGDEQTTDANGIATFSNLEVGFYLVVETTSPAIVTGPCDPFLVSIPMTEADGSDWLYDVHVYPKNSTSVGSVSLKKYAQDGETLLDGVTFALQKEVDGKWVDITKESTTQGDNAGDLLELTTKNGTITVENLSSGKYRFVETSVGANHGYIMDGATPYEFTVNGAEVTYNETTGKNVTISVVNEKPDLTKEVQDRTDGTWGQDSDYNIGDSIPYQITVTVPENITKLATFKVTDTPNNLDYNGDLKITCGDAEVISVYTVEKTNVGGFVVTFSTEKMTAYAGKTLVLSYTAILQDEANTTVAGNQNTAKLEYSNAIYPNVEEDPQNPNFPDNPDNPDEPIVPNIKNDTIEDNAIVYTFKLAINKTDENDNPLPGVKFDLYKEYTETVIEDTTLPENVAFGTAENGLDTTKRWEKIATDLTTGRDGTISYSGLANGTYYLVETSTVEGYNLLKAPVPVKLNIDYVTSMKETWSWTVDTETGLKTLVKHEITTKETKFTDISGDTNTTSDGTLTQTVINKKGFTLPATGGMGSIIFIVGGIALAMAGLLIILASNKKAAR